MSGFAASKRALSLGLSTLVQRRAPGRILGRAGIPQRASFSTLRTEFVSDAQPRESFNLKPQEQSDKRFLNYKSEATCTRKVYSDNDKVTLGPPTFTIFSAEVCLTLKVTKDELTGENSLLLTGMTRLKDGSNGFNKNSRISSVLPVDALGRLNEALRVSSDNPVTFEGLDGGSVVVTNRPEEFSVKLHQSLLPGLNLSPGMLPNLTTKGKSCVEFAGAANEHALVAHALREIAAAL